jgi:glutathione S-transferase
MLILGASSLLLNMATGDVMRAQFLWNTFVTVHLKQDPSNRPQLEDLDQGASLLPKNPQAKAHSRLWVDHINRKIIPLFYRFLQEQQSEKQITHASELKSELQKLIDAAHSEGPFFLDRELSFVDIQFAPWMLRFSRVLKPYRGWPDPEPGSRWQAWMDAVEHNPSVAATTSGDELYLDSYERYAGKF